MPEGSKNLAKEKTLERLHDLLTLQKELICRFGEEQYNIFVFGSYITTSYVEGKSDVDIAVYTENFELYKQLSLYLEEYFSRKNIPSDIFFIDISMAAAIYCAPLKSQVRFTNYFPEKLSEFAEKCQEKLDEIKWKAAV